MAGCVGNAPTSPDLEFGSLLKQHPINIEDFTRDDQSHSAFAYFVLYFKLVYLMESNHLDTSFSKWWTYDLWQIYHHIMHDGRK